MKVMRKIELNLQLFAVLFMLSFMPFSWAEETSLDDPAQVVSNLQDSLIQAMRAGDEMDFQQRVDFLAPAINQSHHFDLIIRAVFGNNWTELDSDQQHQISDTFRQLSIATYAGQFNEYGGEQFEVLQQRDLPRGQTLIRSQLIKGDGGKIDFDYVLQQGNNGWRIVNILVDGVSDLALKRTEYRAILQRDGFQALIEMLEEKIRLAEQG